MNIRFYHAKILLTKADHTFEVTEGELWVRYHYLGPGDQCEGKSFNAGI